MSRTIPRCAVLEGVRVHGYALIRKVRALPPERLVQIVTTPAGSV